MTISTGRSAIVTLLACMIAACGGGDGGDHYLGSGGGGGNSGNGSAGLCAAGVSACSGDVETSRIGPLKLTAAGVQVTGASTNDLLATPGERGMDAQLAYGLTPWERGLASMRVARAADGAVTAANLLLSGFGLSWDGVNERPPILETFGMMRGRIQANPAGMATLTALPAADDRNFWNNDPVLRTGTQANYANNLYFTRQPLTGHCAEGDAACVSAAQNGLRLRRGDWRDGGVRPDQVEGERLHEDGATLAPDALPFAGFKGYRNLWNWNYRHAQLAGWITQDTVDIVEWGGNDEHNKSRRGIVAFGEPTPPKAVPATGKASYAGLAHGWYSPSGAIEPYPIAADVLVQIDFAARTATIRLFNVRIDEAQNPSPQFVPDSSNTLPFGTGNTLGGAVTHGSASGHLAARFFGPVSSGAPAEIAGAFSLRGSESTGITGTIFGIGGFIARRTAS